MTELRSEGPPGRETAMGSEGTVTGTTVTPVPEADGILER